MYVLSTPFAVGFSFSDRIHDYSDIVHQLYGAAFFLIGMAPFVKSVSGRGWTQNVATGFYALAASSGSVFFALNFGDEGM